jgi:cardiolipin synthase (CMP-forming)
MASNPVPPENGAEPVVPGNPGMSDAPQAASAGGDDGTAAMPDEPHGDEPGLNGPMGWMPNALTRLRIVIGPFVAIALMIGHLQPQTAWLMAAAVAFLIGAVTDGLDGWLARRLNARSRAGARLDPLADKLFAGGALIGLVATREIWALNLIPVIAILGRDMWMNGLRARLLMETGHDLRPTGLAKIKTAVELTGLGFLVCATPFAPFVAEVFGFADPAELTMQLSRAGIAMLWVAAALSLFTAWRYAGAARRIRGAVAAVPPPPAGI